MIESDRARFIAAFEALCLVHDRRLDADGFDKLAGAYWVACAKMDVRVFEQVCERAAREADRFPKPATLWALAKELRRGAPAQKISPPVGDWLDGFANRRLFAWLWAWTMATKRRMPEAQLARIIEAKNHQLAMFRALHDDRDPEATTARFDRFLATDCARIAPVA